MYETFLFNLQTWEDVFTANSHISCKLYVCMFMFLVRVIEVIFGIATHSVGVHVNLYLTPNCLSVLFLGGGKMTAAITRLVVKNHIEQIFRSLANFIPYCHLLPKLSIVLATLLCIIHKNIASVVYNNNVIQPYKSPGSRPCESE